MIERTILCCDGKAYDGFRRNDYWSNHLSEQMVGFTPQPGLRHLGTSMYFQGHRGKREEKVSGKGTGCITFTSRQRFQVWTLENIGQAAINAPFSERGFSLMGFAWSEIEYKVCCNGETTANFKGSVLPSYYGYLDDLLVQKYSWSTNAGDNYKSFFDGANWGTGDSPAHR